MATPILEQCCIINLDAPDNKIEARYNPTNVSIGNASSEDSADALDFGNTKARILSVELFFDGIEGKRFRESGTPINVETAYVEPLISLTRPDKEQPTGAPGEITMRPPFVMIASGRMRPFRGIIDSLSYDYSVFLPSGIPIKATVHLNVTEVDMLQMTSMRTSTYKCLAQ